MAIISQIYQLNLICTSFAGWVAAGRSIRRHSIGEGWAEGAVLAATQARDGFFASVCAEFAGLLGSLGFAHGAARCRCIQGDS